MPSLRHTHTYVQYKGRAGFWRCASPQCSHYTDRENVVGKLSLCNNCEAEFILDYEALLRRRPLCLNCANTKKGRDFRAAQSVRPEVTEVLRRWVRKAEHDLEAARLILAGESHCPYDTACFHCHQAAEKYLKALLTLRGIQAPRTHDLGKLLALLPAESRPSVQAAQLVAMNPYAVEVRYADDWLEPEREEALRSLELAERVGAEARRLLPAEVLN